MSHSFQSHIYPDNFSEKQYPAPDRNAQKKIAVINDFTGFGRCSITVILPIISALKIQCCPVLTSIFSNHTAYDSFYFDDYTNHMKAYTDEWKKLGLTFDGIYTGYLSSVEQITFIQNFIEDFKTEHTLVIVDPVMGDDGKPYSSYRPELCEAMRSLVRSADILTPNITEACILTDTSYKKQWEIDELSDLTNYLSQLGPKKIVITGLLQPDGIGDFCYEQGKTPVLMCTEKIGTPRCGTGDIFSSIIAADAVNGIPFPDSVKKASHFVKACIQRSLEIGVPQTDGVCFEEMLHLLIASH